MTTESIRTHVQIIAWLNIVLGIMSLIGGFIAFAMLGGLGIFAATQPTQDPNAGIIGTVFGSMGAFIAGVALVSALPSLLIGWGMLRYAPWSRIACIVLSILHLINASTLGLSTVLGIYSLIILLQSDCNRVFRT